MIDCIRRRDDLPQRNCILVAVVQRRQQNPRIFRLPLRLKSAALGSLVTITGKEPLFAHSYQRASGFELRQYLPIILLCVFPLFAELEVATNVGERRAGVATVAERLKYEFVVVHGHSRLVTDLYLSGRSPAVSGILSGWSDWILAALVKR